jgi:hypothetical protein
MTTFFSGTDTSELCDNCVNFNYFISLIVNFDNKNCAKIAFPTKSEVVTKLSIKDSLGNIFNKNIREEQQTILIGDLEIEIESSIETGNWLSTRINALKEKRKVELSNKPILGYSGGTSGIHSVYKDPYNSYDDFYRDDYYSKPFSNKKTKPTTSEFLLAFLNLDADKKNFSIYNTLVELSKIDDKSLSIFEDALNLNIEIIYANIFTDDLMMANLETTCKNALMLFNSHLDSYKFYANKKFVGIVKKILNKYAK